MRITPLDVRKQEFDRALRGLDPDEVHAFLATVADEYEAVLTDNKQLREKVIELDQKVAEYRNMERTLRDTLLTAERVMTDARQNARKEAENILREAEVKAREATSNIQNQVDALRAQMRELRGQRDGFLARLQSLAEAQMGLTQSYRQDFKEDDDRTERLMRDPGAVSTPPVVDVASVVPDPVDTTPTPDATTAEGPVSELPSAPRPEPAQDDPPVAEARVGESDSWRDYDLKVGATPSSPMPQPVETGLPVVEPEEPVAEAETEPSADTPVDDRVDPRFESDPGSPDDTHFERAMDEVTDAVDSALEPSGPVMPIPPREVESASGSEESTGFAPAIQAAEAAGSAQDAIASPDLPDPTGETPVEGQLESAESDGSGRWSLSRFTKGLSSF